MLRFASIHLASLVLIGGAFVPGLAAQSRGTTLAQGSSFAITAGRLWFDGSDSDPALTELALRFATLRHNRLSLDAGAGVVFADGVGALTAEAGPAFDVSLPGAILLLRAGVSTLVAGGGGVIGAYAGLGLILRLGNGVGLRLDVARHAYGIADGSVGAWRVGGGIALLPRIR
jgi:hypothetical protein